MIEKVIKMNHFKFKHKKVLDIKPFFTFTFNEISLNSKKHISNQYFVNEKCVNLINQHEPF